MREGKVHGPYRGVLDHEGHERTRKPRKTFAFFVTFRVFRGPNVPGLWVVATRSLASWLGYAHFANTYHFRRGLLADFTLRRVKE